MVSEAMMPMDSAACASISFAVTSPMAKMCGTYVRQRASMSIAPRSVSFTPVFSRP